MDVFRRLRCYLAKVKTLYIYRSATEFEPLGNFGRTWTRPTTTEKWTRHSNYIQVLLRIFWLQVFKELFKWRDSMEKPKVAIYKDRRVALVRSVIHLVPMVIALIMLSLSFKGTVVPSYTPYRSTILQFVAKFVEVLIQASLVDIYLGVIRSKVLKGDWRLPLGSFFGPIHTTNISYLWSLDFWAQLKSDYQPWRQRLFLFLFSVCIIVVAILSGPSSAVLIIPRQHNETIDNVLHFIGNTSSLFPSRINLETFSRSLE
jgi:hypothetical protein